MTVRITIHRKRKPPITILTTSWNGCQCPSLMDSLGIAANYLEADSATGPSMIICKIMLPQSHVEILQQNSVITTK